MMDTTILEIRVMMLESMLIDTNNKKAKYLSHLRALIEVIEGQNEDNSIEIVKKLEDLYQRIRKREIT
jgi:hypothetical protein